MHGNVDPDSMLSVVADADGDLSLSLKAILRGFMKKVGGPIKFGQEVADIFGDEETNQTQKVAIANNVMKLLGQFGDGDDQGELVSNDKVVARLKQLDAELEQRQDEA